jgi:hypothetical protein
MGIRRLFTKLVASRAALLFVNGAFVLTILSVGVVGTSDDASPILSSPLARVAQELEADTAKAPTPEKVAELAATYVGQKQPGLALALLDRYPTMKAPEIRLARAHALYANGKASQALAALDDLGATCEARREEDPCPAWVVAKSLNERAFFTEMVRAGIEDPARDPEATEAAFDRSRREVRLVAVR